MITKITELFKKTYGELHLNCSKGALAKFLHSKGLTYKGIEKDFDNDEVIRTMIRLINGNFWRYLCETSIELNDDILAPKIIFEQNKLTKEIDVIFDKGNFDKSGVKIILFTIPFKAYYQMVKLSDEPAQFFFESRQIKKYDESIEKCKQAFEKFNSEGNTHDFWDTSNNRISLNNFLNLGCIIVLEY